MRAREFYGRYRQRIGALANDAKAGGDWLEKLHGLLRQFEFEAAGLQPRSAALLRSDLCAQLEHNALLAAGAQREVFFAAVKCLELQAPELEGS
jgi:hypothetical protein